MDNFRVRLNCIDHYQAVPHDEFDPPVPVAEANCNVKDRPRVSVLRVFGATETGQKVLMHVHGAFQYTYIERGDSWGCISVTFGSFRRSARVPRHPDVAYELPAQSQQKVMSPRLKV